MPFAGKLDPFDVYSIPVVDGQPGGKPELMKKDVVLPGMLLGATQDGNLYYGFTADESRNIHMVNLDPATGQVVSKPARLNQTFVNSSVGPPVWSPDGQWLAYAKAASGSPMTLMIRSAVTGEERELTVSPPLDSTALVNPRGWFPDSRSLLVRENVNDHIDFRKVDVQTGKQQLFFEWPGSEVLQDDASLSLDGKILFFSLCKRGANQTGNPKVTDSNTFRLMRRNMETGEDRELYQFKSASTIFRALRLSGDGGRLAFIRLNTDNTTSLLTIQTDGGDARERYRSNLLIATRSWTKDGRHILVVQSDPNSGMNQLWSVSTESGEAIPTGLTFPLFGGDSFHPDGRRFTYDGRQPGQTELWVMKILPPNAKPSR